MSVFDAIAFPKLRVRTAVPEDHRALGNLMVAAYGQYAGVIARQSFPWYPSVRHIRPERLLVAEVDDRIHGSATFHSAASRHNIDRPTRYACGGALTLHPDARGKGVAHVLDVVHALLAACERLAKEEAAHALVLRTAAFMGSAISLIELRGYRRAPEFDVDLGARFGTFSGAPMPAIAHVQRWEPHAA